MPSSKIGYFIKLLLVSLLVIAGFVSLLKETAFITKESKIKDSKINSAAVLADSVNTQSTPSATLKLEATPVSLDFTNDYTVRVPVLMYHHIRNDVPVTEPLQFGLTVTPEVLNQQLDYIQQNGYQTISLNDLYDSLENKNPLPPKSIILTFDDGYRDFYTTAFPLLKKYNLRAVSFFIAGYFDYPDYMNLNMVKEIYKSGLVDVESHTIDHLLLTKMTLNQAKNEIFGSKKILEETLGKKVNYFAYPYGEFNDQIIRLVKEAGYKLAFGTTVGSDLHSSEEFFLKRVPINGFDSFDTFKAKLDR